MDNDALISLLPAGRVIVVCGRDDDASAWRDLVGPARCLAIALDAMAEETYQPLHGASDQLAWQHRTIADLDGTGSIARAAAASDSAGSASLLIPDPLDPLRWGARRRVGPRQAAGRLVEDKTVVDGLWDALGLPRERSIVVDPLTEVGMLASLGVMVDRGTGVVCCRQPLGGSPTAGGDGIWWWRPGSLPPSALLAEAGPARLRVMPLLEGTPTRLHGFVTERRVIPFPPLEIVTLLRPPTGTFLCAGTVRTLRPDESLTALTERIGVGIREHLDYRGGFSVDGIHTEAGFRPTDFNARLTSAMESAPPELRVRLHLANLLVRDGIDVPAGTIDQLAADIYAFRGERTLYGAARCIDGESPRTVTALWDNGRLVRCDTAKADAVATVRRSPRGWLVIVRLVDDRVPRGPLGSVAPAVFRFCDDVLGTDFGLLEPPLGVGRPLPSPRRGAESAEAGQRRL